MDELRTERLVGTRPLLRDADELHGIGADRRMLIREMDHWKRHRLGRWVWREGGAVVGLAGLLVVEDAVELAWLPAADRWDHGLAAEVAEAAAAYAAERGLTGGCG